MSNARKLRQQPRPPDPVEAGFRDALRAGCPHCHSRKVVGKWRGVWSFTLVCGPDCPTHRDERLAHAVAADAAKRAGVAAGEALSYRALDTSSGEVGGVVVGAG